MLCTCTSARHLILCLVLVQPMKIGKRPDMFEKLFIGTLTSKSMNKYILGDKTHYTDSISL